jgi:hypothetical protein
MRRRPRPTGGLSRQEREEKNVSVYFNLLSGEKSEKKGLWTNYYQTFLK